MAATSRHCRHAAALLLLVGTHFCSGSARAVEPAWELEFLAGLRSRGLYRLAARHADSLLYQDALPDASRIDLAIEYSRTLAEWGHALPPSARELRWQQAHDVLQETLGRLDAHPRALLVELQDALLWLAEGKLAQEEAALTASEAATATAREKLRKAVAALEKLAEQVEDSLRRQRMARGEPAHHPENFSVDQLTSLSHHVALQTVRTLQSQAETYPPDSPDRVNSLTRAVDQLSSVLRRVGENDLRRQAEVELIACRRLLGHHVEARRLLVESQRAAGAMQAALASEDVRLRLAEGRAADALAAARKYRDQLPNPSAELLLAQLQAVVSHAATSADPAWQRAAIDEATRILFELEQQHGPRWQRRGELWVARLLTVANHQADTAQTARLAAEGLYRAGRTEEAVAAFDRAVRLARDEDEADVAHDLEFTAASVVQQNGDHAHAAARYLDLARNQPAHPRAPESHRHGILATVAVARARADDEPAELLDSYGQLLQEHLDLWPQATTADDVRLWLARWRLQTGDTADVPRVLAGISSESEHYAEACRLLVEVYQQRIASLEDPSARAELANEAAHALQPIITGPDNSWPSEWTPLERETAVALARLQLDHADGGAAYAERLLTAALASTGGAEDEDIRAWRQHALGLLLAADALQARHDRIEPLLRELHTAPAELKIEIAGYLTDPRIDVDAAARMELSRLALQLIGGISPTDAALSPETLRQIARHRARALARAGDRSAAIAHYADLIGQHAHDAAMHEEYAALLAAGETADEQRAAMRMYQQIEQRTKPGGPRWMRARLERIRLLLKLSERSQAQQLLKLTATVHPDLGGPEHKAQFQELQRSLGE